MVDDKLFDDDFLQRLGRLGMIAKRMPAAASAGGQRRSHRLGDGLEFADHRAYAAGDDLRFLDWPYFARMEKLLLRMFHEHSEGAVTLLVDASASMGLGSVRKFDYARRASAALAYVAMVGLDRVNILPFAESLQEGLQTGRNRGQILQVLEFLAGLPSGGRTELDEVISLYVKRYARTGTVIIVSDLLDVEDCLSDTLAILRQRKDEAIVLHVVDACDRAPALAEAVQLLAVEAQRRLNVVVTEELLASYAQRWGEFSRGLEKTCLSRGAVYVQAPTEQPFERLVLETLRKAGMLRQ